MIQFLAKLLALTRPYRVRFGLGILFGIFSGFSSVALVLTIKLVIRVIFPSPDALPLVKDLEKLPVFVREFVSGLDAWLPSIAGPNHSGVVFLIIALIPLVMFLRGLLSYLNIYFLQWVAIRAITDLRTRLFHHLLNLPLGFFHGTSTGTLMSRLLNDSAALQNTISSSLAVIIRDPVTVISLASWLIWTQPRLTLISLLIFPAAVIPVVIYSRKVRKASEAIQTSLADLSNLMHEAFTGNRIIKAYNLESTVQEKFVETSRRFVSQYMRIIRSSEIPGPLIEFFGALGVALVFAYIKLTGKNAMKPEDFFQFITSIFLMYQPIKALTRLQTQLEQGRAASLRVFELLDTQSTLVEPLHPVPLQAVNVPLEFADIDFTYGDKQILKGIRLCVRPGQIVALVGSSGSGKTTLANLVLRFYDPQRGAVRIGGTDVRHVSLRDLRSHIGVVTQETILFNDTFRNNIRYGRPGATDAEIEDAARHAHAHEFIMDKPKGYETVIGEKGVTLSGGQRQRIAIARAILKNAPILILDEATSALDTEAERAVQADLEELMQHRTTICIAHRLSTIQNADVIVVLDQGQIVEMGKHEELLQRRGIYQKLYELQFQT